MMNQNPENQQNEKSEAQAAQDRAQEQRRILEERLAEINAKNAPASNSADVPAGEQPSASAPESPAQPTAPQAEAPAQPEKAAEEAPSAISVSDAPATPVEEPATPEVEVPAAEEVSAETVSETQVDSPAAEAPANPTKVAAPVVEEEGSQADVLASEAPIATPAQQDVEQPKAETTATAQAEPVAAQPPIEAVTPAPTSPAAQTPSEEEHHDEEEGDQHEDLSALPVEEVRSRILNLTKEGSRKHSKTVNELYRIYDQHFQEERQEALKRFIADGGEEDAFEYHAPAEHREVEQAMQRYREARYREQRQEEENKIQNLQKKKDLLERLRELVESSETQTSGNAIKELQNEWKAIGAVPNAEAQELWNSYHALLDMYYNNRSIFFELKELDRKRNLDAKTVLCERAEALANEENINKALQELRHLHDEWKHIGPVPNESRDAIWDRFIQASEKVHDRKKEFFETRRTQELANLEVKRGLLAEMEQFQNIKTDRINDWRDKTDQIQKLKERWDAAGLVPKENAEEVNKAFWSSYKAFFHNKNAFFKALDEEKMNNYRQKVELCEEAESLQNSEDWDSTKEKLIQLQKKWKTIGRVPDKYSDKVWNRFRTACNTFFDRLHQEASNREAQQHQLSAQKTNYLEQLSAKVADPTFVGSLDEFKQIHEEWKGMANEGKRNPKLEDRFQQTLAKYLDKVPELTPEQKEQTLFQLQLNHLKASPEGEQKLYQKEQHLRREITGLENDISTLNTNIEFFARSKNAEKLREEYQTKIDEAQHRIDHLKRQLKALRAS